MTGRGLPKNGKRASSQRLMRFFAVNFLVGLAVGAQMAFNGLNEPKEKALLRDPGPLARRAIDTFLRHLPVLIGHVHGLTPGNIRNVSMQLTVNGFTNLSEKFRDV